MRLAEIDFSPYTQARYLLISDEGHCFIGACGAAQGFSLDTKNRPVEDRIRAQMKILSRLEDLPARIPVQLLYTIWYMNDTRGNTFEEIREFVLWAVS